MSEYFKLLKPFPTKDITMACVTDPSHLYKSRNFTDLMIAFGCTGGQHRSVYCSNQLRDYIKEKYNQGKEIVLPELRRMPDRFDKAKELSDYISGKFDKNNITY